MADTSDPTTPPTDGRTDSDGARKIFIGGLSWQTTEDGLKHYFESKGMPVDMVVIMRDKLTGRSRGFGFVTFLNLDYVDRAVNTDLVLDGRRIEAKLAIPKREMDSTSKKVFVGGIPVTLSESDFRSYFESFGQVVEAQVMTERTTGRSRGFGFVTFADEIATKAVLKNRHVVNGKLVEVKKAEPKRVDRRPIQIIPFPMPYFPHYAANGPMYAPHAFYGTPFFDPTLGAYFAQYTGPQYIPVDMSHEGYSSPQQIESPTERRNSKGSSSPTQRKHSINGIPLLRVSAPSQKSESRRRSVVIAPSSSTNSAPTRSRRGASQPASALKSLAVAPFRKSVKTKSEENISEGVGIHQYFQ